MTEEKKYEKRTLGWLREQAKKDGFDNIRNWQNWKNKLKWSRDLENAYGKEFADWAVRKKGKVPDKWLDAGCKNNKAYLNKCAQKRGFKNDNERLKQWMYETGMYFPKDDNEDCPAWFGDFTENLMIQTFEGAKKMPFNNPGFDWICKNGYKIDNKARCLRNDNRNDWCGWHYSIRQNNLADYFILSAWDNRDSLNPLHVWIFHKNDVIRGRKFCEFEGFLITNNPEKLKKLKEYEFNNRLKKLEELCQIKKEEKNNDILHDCYPLQDDKVEGANM